MDALRVRFSARAVRESQTIARWWRENREVAPDLFKEELAGGLGVVARYPTIGMPVEGTRHEGVRRYTLKRTRYALYYVVMPGKPGMPGVIRVLAIWHCSRGSEPAI